MQQPNNNSDAVKRCMTMPIAPPSSQLRFQPHPPYAAGKPVKKRPRPFSAPQSKGSYTVPWHGPSYQVPKYPTQYHNVSLINYRPLDTDISNHAPFAARKLAAFVDSELAYPRVDSGKRISKPSYDALTDPHLIEYFRRRFGSLQLDEAYQFQRRSSSWSRSDSPRSSRLLPKRRKLDQDQDVLYKVAVTTVDAKNAGTDAKTSATKEEEAWYLQEIEVVVTDLKNPQWKYFFPCGQWLAKDEGDREISRDLIGSIDPLAIRKSCEISSQSFSLVTSLELATDANVFINTMFGFQGDSGEKSSLRVGLTSLKGNRCIDVANHLFTQHHVDAAADTQFET
ncbi:Lipoxygenase y domain-containing protein 1 [Bulinus truncatus]|nr:Lipoxygenase y domain-containing protein 1 [Bulinus truncatus]